ncbi:MAG: hypothetical protein K2Y51_26175 [Gammaproteobacteria bacterium]|nr:hypothetical protein [Gammaproteobacteria bacterium]
MDTTEFIGDLEAGNFATRIAKAITLAAAGAVTHGKKGQVSLDFEFSRVPGSAQVSIKHKLAFVEPTLTGKASEEHTAQTVMYVNNDGSVTLLPGDTRSDLFGKEDRKEGRIHG